jgi:hypothetical protein
MKLYRGIKAQGYLPFTPENSEFLKNTWETLISERAQGDFDYPEELNQDILEASKLVRLQRQYFTDNKEIALSYAKDHEGVLIEIDVSVPDILESFTLEFQKFAQRRQSFEIVYGIDAAKLFSFSKKWKLKAKNIEKKS